MRERVHWQDGRLGPEQHHVRGSTQGSMAGGEGEAGAMRWPRDGRGLSAGCADLSGWTWRSPSSWGSGLDSPSASRRASRKACLWQWVNRRLRSERSLDSEL